MAFRICGLDPEPFRHLFGLPDAELARQGVVRWPVEAKPGVPDRIELRDLEPGETALLLNHLLQPADTPYRSSHAIFVREGAERAHQLVDAVPEVLSRRPLSIRAFDGAHMMVDAALVDGAEAEPVIRRFLDDPAIVYLHAHAATRGCLSCPHRADLSGADAGRLSRRRPRSSALRERNRPK